MDGLRDYVCSHSEEGPWVAVFASGYDQAAKQFARAEEVSPGETVFVGVPSPVPDVFTSETLSQFIAQRLGIQTCRELQEMAHGLAGEANYRVQKFASDRVSVVGNVMQVRAVPVTEAMARPQHSLV